MITGTQTRPCVLRCVGIAAAHHATCCVGTRNSRTALVVTACAQHWLSQHSTACAQRWWSHHCKAQHSAGGHSTAQHSTTQHSTSQHSTAQHSAGGHITGQHVTGGHSTAQMAREPLGRTAVLTPSRDIYVPTVCQSLTGMKRPQVWILHTIT
jgi:hypothetical protein